MWDLPSSCELARSDSAHAQHQACRGRVEPDVPVLGWQLEGCSLFSKLAASLLVTSVSLPTLRLLLAPGQDACPLERRQPTRNVGALHDLPLVYGVSDSVSRYSSELGGRVEGEPRLLGQHGVSAAARATHVVMVPSVQREGQCRSQVQQPNLHCAVISDAENLRAEDRITVPDEEGLAGDGSTLLAPAGGGHNVTWPCAGQVSIH